MYDVFLALFGFFKVNLSDPIANALLSSHFFDSSYSYIMSLIGNIFRLWNNDNILTSNVLQYSSFCIFTADIITILLLVFSLWSFLKIFISIYNIIVKGLSKC